MRRQTSYTLLIGLVKDNDSPKIHALIMICLCFSGCLYLACVVVYGEAWVRQFADTVVWIFLLL